ncbi:nuclear transport factor 2 family protein [Streptomyces beihaiensis]|uniref:Nuclear transport factor 2 family protein n=1 Tax=Streptomyces beihaiensis TaxID=2984495 RepID=A0ABT3TV99_9ACTN|nr:nuclear transport factor 2 family protein [Streptomyces beihaiensis]MCX3060965.1 nuclear transport factor 2 family protein [Streptomyces beihaiensis]
MTQRVELATVLDRLAVDELVTDYAAAVDDGDWAAYRALFAPGARADYRAAGGVDGSADDVARWLESTMELFPMRQHLIVNRRIRFGLLERDDGDTAQVRADYINPMRSTAVGGAEENGAGSGGGDGAGAPDFVCGGRYDFALVRTHSGWRLHGVTVHEKWRRLPSPPVGTRA